MNKNYFGICEWALPVTGTLAIEIAAEMGFDGIQIAESGGTKMSFPLNNKRVQDAYLNTSDKHHIKLHSLNLGSLLQEGTIFNAPDTLLGIAARTSLKNGILACSEMNISSMVCTVSPSTEAQLHNSIEHLKYACNFATSYNVTICLESILPLNTILKVLNACPSSLKICMDILNPHRFNSGDACEQIISFSTNYIHHFHMKDSLKGLFSPDQRGCVLLGKGDVGLPRIIDTINTIGYHGWFISENYYYLPPMNQNDDFIKLAKQDLSLLRAVL